MKKNYTQQLNEEMIEMMKQNKCKCISVSEQDKIKRKIKK